MYPTLFGSSPGTNGRVVVLGAPYDRGGPQHHAGCAGGPAALRTASHPSSTNAARHGVFDLRSRKHLFDSSALSDMGDVPYRPSMSDDDYLAFVSNAVRLISKEGKKPLLLGGDHLVTLAALRGLRETDVRFQVVHLDAHHDYEDTRPDERPTHSSFIGFAAAEGLVSQVLQVGVRGLTWGETSAPSGVRLVDVADLGRALQPDLPVYLSIDTDAFDPTLAMAVNYPEPEGLTSADLRAILRAITEHHDLLGADWMEFNPTLDTKNHSTGRFIATSLAIVVKALLSEARP